MMEELFLDIKVLQNERLTGGVLLNEKIIKEILIERLPFFKIDRAIYFNDNLSLLGVVEVKKEACEGHFPGKPIIPLILLAEAMAQTSVLTAAAQHWFNIKDKDNLIPIAIGCGEAKMLAKKFLSPPMRFLIKTEILKKKMSLYLINAAIYSEHEKIAEIKTIKCQLIPANLLPQ